MALSPVNQRRFAQFRAHRRGWYSLWLFLLLFVLSLGAELIANDKPLVLFGGINVLESRELAMRACEEYVRVTDKLGIPYVFKA
ncbi:MAG: hypothetical protein QMB92_09810, partial [Thiopseudomonas sp.]